MLDLYGKKYDKETLKRYIYLLNLIDILKTQRIDADFAARYILNKKYQLTEEEESINPSIVLKFQHHISKEALQKALINYDSDDDSILDFEQTSLKNIYTNKYLK